MFWYSSIEVSEGQFTRDQDIPPTYWTSALTRTALRTVNIAGTKCLDIGAVDGFLSTVLSRSGASRVVAVDVADYTPQIQKVQSIYNVEFEYIPRVGSLKIVDRILDLHKYGRKVHASALREKDDFAFDIIVCSGVLYHVYSPLHLIGALRTLIRPGGIVVLETALVPEDSHFALFNRIDFGYAYAETDTWVISIPLIDYLIRSFYFEPLGIVYRNQKALSETRMIGRGALVLRAVDTVLPRQNDILMEKSCTNFEYDDLFQRGLEINKSPAKVGCSMVRSHGTLLGAAQAQANDPIPYELARLRLTDEN